MILGIGCDIIELERFEESLSRHGDKLLERLFTKHEQEYCRKFKDANIRFAARFAAKEAIAKALGCGIGKTLGWHDIEISHEESGRPIVLLIGKFKNIKVHLSISHSHTVAMAYAIAEAI